MHRQKVVKWLHGPVDFTLGVDNLSCRRNNDVPTEVNECLNEPSRTLSVLYLTIYSTTHS